MNIFYLFYFLDDTDKIPEIDPQSMDEDSQRAPSMASMSTENTVESSDALTENDSSSIGDINQKIRQQLNLLKTRKSDLSLISTKDIPINTESRMATLSWRRSNSNELKSKPTNAPSSSSNTISSTGILQGNLRKRKASDAEKKSEETDANGPKESKLVSGMIDSLYNKFKSINQSDSEERSVSTRLRLKSSKPLSPAQTATSTPIRRSRREESTNKSYAFSDSNQEDSNQSSNSVSIEFHGFDIPKNVDVSALLPTPKAPTSNSQSAFISADLDTFLKENALEKGIDISIKPKFNADEALMTTDAQPPTLAVPERPMDMQRPRTLAEKRMILQQQNDVSILIIENESTVYHELKKRVKFGSDYDNSLMQRIQDANVPFTRDCWRAACWIATSNNRFFYRTMIIDNEEIKLIGGRGDNQKKLTFRMKTTDVKKISAEKYLPRNCSPICSPIENIKINNIDTIIANIKIHQDNLAAMKMGSIFGMESKKAKMNMFSREYLAPGPKCKKAKCKWNRSTSFDLEYGPLQLLRLPTVQLEVWPQIGLSLPEHIKPLLKTMMPETNVITPEWAQFAVSVVKETSKSQPKHRRKYKKPESEPPKSFVFEIPYENNEKKILMRRRRRSSIVFDKNDAIHEKIESFYQEKKKYTLKFTENIDRSDSVAVECGEILTNMIESVAIAVNETNFIKLDPDIDYIGKTVPVSELNKEISKAGSKTEKEKTIHKTESAAKIKLM